MQDVQDSPAIEDRHLQVQKDAIWHHYSDTFERLLPIRGEVNRKMVGFQDRLEQLATVRIIVDD